MHVWLPIPYRVALRFHRRQTAVYAQCDLGAFEVPEIQIDGPGDPVVTSTGRVVEYFDHQGRTFRPILDGGEPASLEHLMSVPPARLFYDWASPHRLAFEDHPCSRNVSFEPDGFAKFPWDEKPPGSGWGILEALSRRELDTRIPANGVVSPLSDLALIDGKLMRWAELPTVTLHFEGPKSVLSNWADRPQDRLPFGIHFGQPHIDRLYEAVRSVSKRVDVVGLNSMALKALATADVAARRTLISAAASMLQRLSRIKFGRVPLQEMDLLLHARDALSGEDDPSVTSGILGAMSDKLRQSPDIGLRRVGKALAFRQGIVEDRADIDDDLALVLAMSSNES